MANGHHISFTAADIERYHRGLMSMKERHAIEKAALDDPFLADALEGYTNTAAPGEDVADLQQRLNERLKEEKKVIPFAAGKPRFEWWKVAAMTLLVAGAGLLVYQIAFNPKRNDIAQAPQEAIIKQENKEINKITPSINSDTNSLTAAPATETEQATKKNIATAAPKKPGPIIAPKNTLPAPAISPTDSAYQGAVADIAANERKEEIKSDNTRFKKSVLTKQQARGFVEPSVSANPAAKQKTETSAAPAGIKDVQDNRAFNQSNIFRGRVTDMHNNALPFSNITNKEDNTGTYSDANGYFTLTYPDTVLTVQVKSLGFVSDNVLLNNNLASNQVQLKEDRNSLSEVVISNKKVNSYRSANNSMVLDEPEPADGWVNYDLYLANNLKTPETFRDKQDGQKEVVLSFEVSKSGEPINITVKRSLCESCDKEAIRLLKEGPKWKRKNKKGKATVTISF